MIATTHPELDSTNMGRMRISLAVTTPVVLTLLLGACVGAEPALVDAGSSSSSGDATHPKAEAGSDATTPDAKVDVKTGGDAGVDAKHPVDSGEDVTTSHDGGHDTGVDSGHDAGHDSGHDAGIDATGICNTGLAHDDGGAPGTVNTTFAGGDKGSIGAATPENVLIDGMGRIYVIGVRNNCVASNSNADFAVTRFLPSGLADTTFGLGADDAGAGSPGSGTVCIDFAGGADAALGGALDAEGNVVLVGYAAAGGDASPLTTVLALVRVLPTGVLDHTFGKAGKVRATPAAPYGTCTTGATCSPPEAQIGQSVAITPAGVLYVVGTTAAYPTVVVGGDNAGFIASFNNDGSSNQNFNPTGAFAGYVTDTTLQDLSDVAVDGNNIVVVGTTLGTASDGGFKNREFITRRYKPNGTLDTTFNAGGTVPGQIITSPGVNDYGQAVRVEANGSILVVGLASVGGVAHTNAGVYASGFTAVARYTSAGVLDTTFGGLEDDAGAPGIFVSRKLQQFPAYSHFQLALECDGQPVLSGYIQAPLQSPAALRLTTAGVIDTTFGPGSDAGGGPGLVNVVFTGKNVIGGAIGVDSNRNILVVAGDNQGNPVLELFNH